MLLREACTTTPLSDRAPCPTSPTNLVCGMPGIEPRTFHTNTRIGSGGGLPAVVWLVWVGDRITAALDILRWGSSPALQQHSFEGCNRRRTGASNGSPLGAGAGWGGGGVGRGRLV